MNTHDTPGELKRAVKHIVCGTKEDHAGGGGFSGSFKDSKNSKSRIMDIKISIFPNHDSKQVRFHSRRSV